MDYLKCYCVPQRKPHQKVHTQYAAPPRHRHSRCCPRHCTALRGVGVERLSTITVLQACTLLKLAIADLAHIIVAVRLIAMHLLKLTAEVIRIGNLLLVWINHLQQAVVAVISPLRHISCNRLVRHNQRAAGLGGFAHLAIEVFNGTCSVLAEHQSTDTVLRGVAI